MSISRSECLLARPGPGTCRGCSPSAQRAATCPNIQSRTQRFFPLHQTGFLNPSWVAESPHLPACAACISAVTEPSRIARIGCWQKVVAVRAHLISPESGCGRDISGRQNQGELVSGPLSFVPTKRGWSSSLSHSAFSERGPDQQTN